MSRHGRHGNHPHPHAGARPARPGTAAEVPATGVDPRAVDPRPVADARQPDPRPIDRRAIASQAAAVRSEPVIEPANQADLAVLVAATPGDPAGPDGPRGTTCTTAQLRRFIKSRPWVPMHELRRRFGILGGDDDVTPMRVGEHTLFIGLPQAEGRMIAELLVGGDVGYELSLDPGAPIVVGVYPMRPVPRG